MAQTNIYLKLDGIDGESLDEDHQGWIEIDSVAWRTSNDASYKIGDPGKAKGGKSQAQVGNITVTKPCDLSSVTLMRNCVLGSGIASGKIKFLKLKGSEAAEGLLGQTRVEYLRIELWKIMVSKVEYTGATEDLKESVELKFTKFKEIYTLQKNVPGSASGGGDFGWDSETQTPT
jgi:type VI secretion system secreted protein Hcp